MKENSATVQAPTVVRTTTPTNVERQAIVSTQTSSPPPPPPPEPVSPPSTAPEINNSSEAEAADGRSIYIKNLPLNATTTQLEQGFKKFGPIKPGGVQVRSNKQGGFCYGFVEFEASSSMHSALEASPIMIGGRPAHVEEKRPAGSRAPRGRFPSGRGGFRNDVTRGRGGYGGRGTYGGRDFGGRGRGSGSGRGGNSEGYQRVDQVGNGGRGARSGGTNQTQRNVQRDGPATG
uniref:RRM domain-containing protein n=1 Tax=Araucaria cunninghamii TaxID=56994 RepID=A0A0D6QZT4_ARACU